MKIIIDLQGCQLDGHRVRGIGRYSLSLIKKLIRISINHEFILFANACLNNISSDFEEELLEFKNRVSYVKWYGPNLNVLEVSNNQVRFEVSKKLRSYALSLINGDILLLTSFFDGYNDQSVISLDHKFNLPPVASVIHDLIPLSHPKDYLDINLGYKQFYLNMLEELSSIDCFLTNSEFTKNELKRLTSLDPNLIFNISSGCNKEIFNPNVNQADKLFREKNLGLYILYCGAADPRKNLKRLLKSYSLLKDNLKTTYKIILVGEIGESALKDIYSWRDQFEISDDQLLLMGFVTDEELAALYRNCSLFVFPSIHEGFGLPVLEAMSCGAPVIASNRTSIPEILGESTYTFNPYNIDEITLLIENCLENQILLNNLKKNSKERSSFFSWDITANLVLEKLEQLVQSKKSNSIRFDDWNLISEYKRSSYNLILDSLISDLATCSEDMHLKKLVRVISTCIHLIQVEFDLDLRAFQFNKNKSINWQIEGPFDSNYSLSILNQEIALAANEYNNLNLKINITEGLGDYKIDYLFLKDHPALFNLFNSSQSKQNKKFILSRNMYPPRVHDMDSRFNCLHAYGWEETGFPADWVNDFNQYLQGITVMSAQVKKTLIDNGVSIPIHICSLGIDHIRKIKVDTSYVIHAKKYKFLHISSCFPRKGIDCLLEAYGNSFSKDDNVSLIIKTFPNPHNNVFKLLKYHQSINDKYPHVVVIEEDLKLPQIKSLYLQSDCLIAPSHGEGFGLPIAEAMALEIPVMTTAWGGQLDFIDSSNAWLIDYKFAYSKSHFNMFSSAWAEPRAEDCALLMKEIYNTSINDIKSKTLLAKERVLALTWDNCVKENLYIFNNFQAVKRKKNSLRVGWVTTWNSRCGLASYSRYLIQNLVTEVKIYAPIDEEITETDEKNVNRCWSINRPLIDLKRSIIRDKITTLVIQFNYGLYDFSELKELIDFLKSKSISVIIFLHATSDPKFDPNRKLSNIKDALIKCDRLMVHSPNDLNRLKLIELTKNVCLFPHGILPFNMNLDKKEKSYTSYVLNNKSHIENKIKLASYGFCLPNKGFPELIYAVKILRDKKLNVSLNLRTASYSQDYIWFYNQLVSLIEQLDLKEYVSIDNHYHDDISTLECLSKVDLIVYPYQYSNESCSGAIRQGLASGTPVAVTPLSIFDDVKPVIYELPGLSSEDIAKGIQDWFVKGSNFRDQNINSSAFATWRKEHSFSSLGIRLQGIINALS
ncbi:glycosyltransferase [Prochlorococcus marinus]|uniref:glycosyltransferase n=1 Tax=Prochlorococcus marinus TaxID=1219 RepID=UPI0022B5A6FE|nr:glycosyltransferase [Prochlorococcus marinus]